MFDNLFYSNKKTQNLVSFEDIQNAIKCGDVIINTLPITDQDCLIKNTLPYQKEENFINDLLLAYDFNKRIYIYGKNCSDDSIDKKYKQLCSLGFTNICSYRGGLFEWLLLNEIYGKEEFPIIYKSTSRIIDLYKKGRT